MDQLIQITLPIHFVKRHKDLITNLGVASIYNNRSMFEFYLSMAHGKTEGGVTMKKISCACLPNGKGLPSYIENKLSRCHILSFYINVKRKYFPSRDRHFSLTT